MTKQAFILSVVIYILNIINLNLKSFFVGFVSCLWHLRKKCCLYRIPGQIYIPFWKVAENYRNPISCLSLPPHTNGLCFSPLVSSFFFYTNIPTLSWNPVHLVFVLRLMSMRLQSGWLFSTEDLLCSWIIPALNHSWFCSDGETTRCVCTGGEGLSGGGTLHGKDLKNVKIKRGISRFVINPESGRIEIEKIFPIEQWKPGSICGAEAGKHGTALKVSNREARAARGSGCAPSALTDGRGWDSPVSAEWTPQLHQAAEHGSKFNR